MKVVSSHASNKIEIGNYSNKFQLFWQLTLFKGIRMISKNVFCTYCLLHGIRLLNF